MACRHFRKVISDFVAAGITGPQESETANNIYTSLHKFIYQIFYYFNSKTNNSYNKNFNIETRPLFAWVTLNIFGCCNS